MTALPSSTAKKLGLVIDLDTCVGCHACATSCKEWNSGGYSAPLTDQDAYETARDELLAGAVVPALVAYRDVLRAEILPARGSADASRSTKSHTVSAALPGTMLVAGGRPPNSGYF